MGSQVEPARRLLVPWNTPPSHLELVLNITQGVSHCGLAIYINKYFKAKEEL